MRLKARAGDGTKTAVGSTEVERNLFVCIELLVSETMSKYMKLRSTMIMMFIMFDRNLT